MQSNPSRGKIKIREYIHAYEAIPVYGFPVAVKKKPSARRPPDTPPGEAARAPSLLRQAYEDLRRRLISGEWPPGTRLDYQRLSQELGFSTTPLREAMGHLASEGLVDLVPRLGAVVKRLSRQDLIEIYEVREAFETYAAQRVAGRLSSRRLDALDIQVARMREVIDRLPPAEGAQLAGEDLSTFLTADRAFHGVIIDALENERLSKLIQDGQVSVLIFNTANPGHTLELVTRANQEHLAILEALRRGDGLEAAQVLGSHIRNSLEGKLEALRKDRF